MRTSTLLVMCIVGACAVATAQYCSAGGSFAGDVKKRFAKASVLLDIDGVACSTYNDASGSGSGGWHSSGSGSGGYGSSGSGSGGWHSSGSGSGGRSGSGSGGWHSSGSGSGSPSGSGSGGWHSSGSGSGGYGYANVLRQLAIMGQNCSSSDRSALNNWIDVVQASIVLNESISCELKFCAIWESLEALFVKYKGIKAVVEFQLLTGWNGLVADLGVLVIELQTEASGNLELTAEECIEFDGGAEGSGSGSGAGDGSCVLFDACDAWARGDSAKKSAVAELKANLNGIIRGSASLSVKYEKCYTVFVSFFAKYSSYKLSFRAASIHGFGSIGGFVDICAQYWRIAHFSIAFGGAAGNCSLTEALYSLVANTRFSKGERLEFEQFADKIQLYFNGTANVDSRVEYFYTELYQYFIVESWTIEAIFSLSFGDKFGTCHNAIAAYARSINADVPFDESTTTVVTPPAATTIATATSRPAATVTAATTVNNATAKVTTVQPCAAPSTVKATPRGSTVAPTNAAVSTVTMVKPTTSAPGAQCGNVYICNDFMISANITILLKAIDDSQNEPGTWTNDQKAQFSGYKTCIYNVSKNQTKTSTEKYTSIKTTLTGFASKTSALYKLVHSIYISVWRGTIAQYCGCSCSGTSTCTKA